MEAPPRKRGRPPKHPKVQASNDSPKNALPQPHSNNHHPPTLNSPSSPADVEMVDRVMPPLVDSRSGQRGRKKSVLDKVDGPSSVMPGPGGGGSPSDRDLSKSEADADDVDSPPERISSRRNKKSSLVHHNASLFLVSFAIHRRRFLPVSSLLPVAGFFRRLGLIILNRTQSL
jgi:hypothetical protein